MTKKKPVNYIDKKEFSQKVHEYVQTLNDAKENNESLPIVTDYISTCFIKICKGIASRPNFSSYSYKDEMIGDGIENCLKAIPNYNIEAATQSGNPNAFGYFSKIVWWCYLRRIAKEKKQADIRKKYIMQSGVDTMSIVDLNDKMQLASVQNYVSTLRSRIDENSGKKDSTNE